MSDAQRIALVTGGGSGLGKATALALREDGFRVFVCGRRPAQLAGVEGVDALVCDVADPDQVERLAARVRDAAGRLDVLVNNAGVSWASGIETFPVEKISYLVKVNLIGTILVTRALTPLLVEQRGVIINMSSALAARPAPGSSVYSATKAGIDAFTRALALELGPKGVRVNAIQPGLVRSEIWDATGMTPGDYEKLLADRAGKYPLRRTGEAEEIGAMVAYLASSKAAWITGAVIPVCGGSSIGYV